MLIESAIAKAQGEEDWFKGGSFSMITLSGAFGEAGKTEFIRFQPTRPTSYLTITTRLPYHTTSRKRVDIMGLPR